MFAMAANPAWWLASIESIKQKKREEDITNKKSERIIRFTCYCPFNKSFLKWYEFTKTDFVYTNYATVCEAGRKNGWFGSNYDLKQHCCNVEHWSHRMLKIFTSELFDVCPDEYTNDIRPNLEAAIRDGPVLLAESILKDKRFKDFITK